MGMSLSDLKPDDPTPFVILSNIYAGVGRWDDVERVREMINDRQLKNFRGYSSWSYIISKRIHKITDETALFPVSK